MPNDKNVITKEQFEKAMQCKTAEELIALAKAEGVEFTKEEAEAYMAELADLELDEETLKDVAGGSKVYCENENGCSIKCGSRLGW